MGTTFDILVIVLSVLLGLFLILSITVIIFILRLVSSIRHIVAKGEQVVDSAEAAAEMFKKAAGPLGMLRTLSNIVETVAKHKQGKE
jgi:cell division septal protein FtsQ